MFNISSDSSARPVTAGQLAYLPRLIAAVKKERYQAIKKSLGLEGVNLTRLSAGQASRLIDALKRQAGNG